MAKLRARLIIGAVGLIAVLVTVFLSKRGSEPPAPVEVNLRRPDLTSPIADELPRPPIKVAPKKGIEEASRARSLATLPGPAADTGTRDWAVVAAIYKDYDAANRRATDITNSSAFDGVVYPERGQGSKYMVVLGRGLTRSRAEEIRQQATAAGLPSDTYVTRLLPAE